MRPEALEVGACDHRHGTEWLALTLLTLGADQSVRVLEALAATLVNRARQPQPDCDLALREPPPPWFHDAAMVSAPGDRLQLCRRIARRALRGSLADPTLGASAFHRLEDNPAWARDLLPVASFGSFLFYELSASE
jgi:N-acetylmuramoyl-L-alanine amidase